MCSSDLEGGDATWKVHGDAKSSIEFEIAGGEVGLIAEALRDFEDPGARLGINTGTIVQRAVHGTDRNARFSCYLLNANGP